MVPQALQNWIDEHISPQGWNRCLNNLRQQKHAHGNKSREKKQIRLNRNLLYSLEELAKAQGQNLEQYLTSAVTEKRGY